MLRELAPQPEGARRRDHATLWRISVHVLVHEIWDFRKNLVGSNPPRVSPSGLEKCRIHCALQKCVLSWYSLFFVDDTLGI